jgi:hypothetical protein
MKGEKGRLNSLRFFADWACEKVAPTRQFEAAGGVVIPCLDDGSAEHPLPGSAERQLCLPGSHRSGPRGPALNAWMVASSGTLPAPSAVAIWMSVTTILPLASSLVAPSAALSRNADATCSGKSVCHVVPDDQTDLPLRRSVDPR